MAVEHTSSTAKSDIQQTLNAIRQTWTRDEWGKRRQIAEARQEWLFSVLLRQRVAIPARAA